MDEEGGILEVEARLKDYISQNLTVINANLQQFSTTAKAGFTQASVHADGTALAVKTMGREMVVTGRGTTGLLHLLSGFGIIPPQIAMVGAEIGNIGKTAKMLPMLLNPVTLGIAAIAAGAYLMYRGFEKHKEMIKGIAELNEKQKESEIRNNIELVRARIQAVNEKLSHEKLYTKEWFKLEGQMIDLEKQLNDEIRSKHYKLNQAKNAYDKEYAIQHGALEHDILTEELRYWDKKSPRYWQIKLELLKIDKAANDKFRSQLKENIEWEYQNITRHQKEIQKAKSDAAKFEADQDKQITDLNLDFAKEKYINEGKTEKDRLKREYDFYKETEQFYTDDKVAFARIQLEKQKILSKIEREELKNEQEMFKSIAEAAFNSFQSITGAYMQIMKQNDEYDYQSAVNKINNSKMTEDQKKKALEKAELDNKKFREKERDAEMAMVLVNAGMAAIKIWTDIPTPLVPAAEIALAISTAAQLAVMGSQKFARGTRSASGGWAMVGEEGPEMAYIPQGSQVYTHNETKNMMGGNRVINLHFNGSNMSPRDVINTLRQAERNGEAATYGMKFR